jgi:hypothetical protein
MFFSAKIAYAQAFQNVQKSAAAPIITKIVSNIVVPVVEVMFLVALTVFVWGVFGVISKGGEPTVRNDAKNHVLWGVIGMVIMLSAYGIIRVIGGTIGVDPFQ